MLFPSNAGLRFTDSALSMQRMMLSTSQHFLTFPFSFFRLFSMDISVLVLRFCFFSLSRLFLKRRTTFDEMHVNFGTFHTEDSFETQAKKGWCRFTDAHYWACSMG